MLFVVAVLFVCCCFLEKLDGFCCPTCICLFVCFRAVVMVYCIMTIIMMDLQGLHCIIQSAYVLAAVGVVSVRYHTVEAIPLPLT